jgi:hypothetical protein
VHSALKGEERDETVEQLIYVEKPDNPTEIVIHVNMLKEGWDVTNLYTIVPLRAANSRTLVEQSIGRGLRLPYGKRTGVGAVDRLTIVSHDRFQEIVDYANSPDSIIRGGLKVVYVSDERSKVVAQTIALRSELSIDIPRITVQPVGDVTRGYREFMLDLASVRLQPVDNEILIQELHRREQHRLMSSTGIVPEDRLEDYLVRGLIDFNDICYDDHAELLYKLAGQAVAHLRSYLENEDEVLNVLQYHQQALVNLIHAQMQVHYEEKAAAYEAHVSKGFTTLRPNNYSAPRAVSDHNERLTTTCSRRRIAPQLIAGVRRPQRREHECNELHREGRSRRHHHGEPASERAGA